MPDWLIVLVVHCAWGLLTIAVVIERNGWRMFHPWRTPLLIVGWPWVLFQEARRV